MMYDYIIVGAGSAGCVLASRLTENPNISVLLLEAGKPDSKREIRIPTAYPELFKSKYDWNYYTEPQLHLNNRQLYIPRGKVIGGSSSINAMIYIRGHSRDYDRWSELGNQGWSFKEVLPYFKKAENRQPQEISEDYGIGGPLNIANLRYTSPLSQAFVEAAVEVGIRHSQDFNYPEPEGVGIYKVTQKNGSRCSSAAAYLKMCRDRANLTILTSAQVTRILFEANRAVAVEYIGSNQVTCQAKVKQEVILSAGAINSPQILMLSGIGCADRLKDLGITAIADLPGVGQNLQDHLTINVIYDCTKPISLDKANTLGNVLKYSIWKVGPIASNIAEAGGFVKLSSSFKTPDVQFHFTPAYSKNHGFNKREGYAFTLYATLLHPQSSGHIHLRCADPLTPPLIQPNFLSHEADLETLVVSVRLCRQILQAKAFDRFRGEEIFPGVEVKQYSELAAYVRNTAETIYHPVGTCKMGKDPMAVVNSQLQVHGIQGLRVVDASIMPTIISGNTNAPTIMIAEKIASLLLSEN